MISRSHSKLLLLGDGGSGKTSLAKRFTEGKFDEFESQTNISDNFFQLVAVNDATIKFAIRDIGGKSFFFAKSYCREADAAMIVYDITNKKSFHQAKILVNKVRKNGKPNMVIALAGNKADLLDSRKVAAEEAQAYAKENGLFFMETSAKTEINVYDMFYEIAKRLPIEKRLSDSDIQQQPLVNLIIKGLVDMLDVFLKAKRQPEERRLLDNLQQPLPKPQSRFFFSSVFPFPLLGINRNMPEGKEKGVWSSPSNLCKFGSHGLT
ncbi:ras-related protein RABF2a-like [Forsythia ovata]|uniref:Ras-related protein RABF2a-like n=1 Tax=Forsythia ovata TaxID=205694 RepID=A0ABD1T6S7_9LAMI